MIFDLKLVNSPPWTAFCIINPPLLNIIHFSRVISIVCDFTNATPSLFGHRRNSEVPLPIEVPRIQIIRSIEQNEIVGQLFRRLKVENVNKRVWGCESVVINSAHHDGHCTVQKAPRQLFSDVIRAQRVLESNVKLVISLQHLPAEWTVVVAREITALTVNVNRHVFTQFANVIFSAACSFAVRNEPGNHFRFRCKIHSSSRF